MRAGVAARKDATRKFTQRHPCRRSGSECRFGADAALPESATRDLRSTRACLLTAAPAAVYSRTQSDCSPHIGLLV